MHTIYTIRCCLVCLCDQLGTLRNRGRKRLEQIPRQRIPKPPGHGHGLLTFVPNVGRGPEEVERSFADVQPREEEHMAAELRVALVADARVAGLAGGGLALPVDQLATDGVVAIRRGREVARISCGYSSVLRLYRRYPARSWTPRRLARTLALPFPHN
jgi:hypothetical protein